MSLKPFILYTFAIADTAGVSGAANVFISVFNAANSVKVIGMLALNIESYAVGAASVGSSMCVYRTTAASGGSLISASAVHKLDTLHPNPVAEIRIENPSITVSGNTIRGFAPAVTSGVGGGAAISAAPPGSAPFLLYPGQGLAFRTADGDVDHRWNMSVVWTEVP